MWCARRRTSAGILPAAAAFAPDCQRWQAGSLRYTHLLQSPPEKRGLGFLFPL
jgi:hypothetical protein